MRTFLLTALLLMPVPATAQGDKLVDACALLTAMFPDIEYEYDVFAKRRADRHVAIGLRSKHDETAVALLDCYFMSEDADVPQLLSFTITSPSGERRDGNASEANEAITKEFRTGAL